MRRALFLCLFALAAGCASFGSATVPTKPVPGIAQASSNAFKVVYAFGGKGDAKSPAGILVPSNGTLYGASTHGGPQDYGTVFGITTQGKETLLAALPTNAPFPAAGPVFLRGTLYGGVQGNLPYNSAALYSVKGGKLSIALELEGPNAANIPGQLIALDGALYGTFESGMYRYEPPSSFKAIAIENQFGSIGFDPGYYLLPYRGLLYGAFCSGGAHNHGSIFSMTPSGHVKGVYAFKGGKDGDCPMGQLAVADGVIYGTTSGYGDTAPDYGTVFRLTLDGRETVLDRFKGQYKLDCQYSMSGVVVFKGVVYGVCPGGSQEGLLYSVSSSGATTTLHSFTGGSDGGDPWSLVVAGKTIYGLATAGGDKGGGVLFSYVP